jgi:signal transduction histidine kinase
MANTKANILLVDDQPQKLLSYEAILEPLDQNVLRASSGKQALEILLKNDIAVVLLDVVMPDMDGFETATMIRSHPRFRVTPIIFASAIDASELERLKAYSIGAVDYVFIPVVPEILRAKVAAFVNMHRKARELQSLNRDLEQRVAERTAELEKTLTTLRGHAAKLEAEIAERKRLESESRLRAEELANADRRKDEFLAMLAHELRNPLAPIRSATDVLLLHGPTDPTMLRASEMIDRQVTHMTRLLDDLLDVSRISGDRILVVKERVNIADVLSQAVETVRPLIDGKQHRLTVQVPPNLIYVNADPTRLAQVVANLLNNAAKYTEPGGLICLSADQESAPNSSIESEPGQVVVRVRDTGIGITPDMLPRVFELFAQADRTLDRSQGGLGLGLTLVQKLVELHGGTVHAKSAGLGRGSEFVVRLPAEALAATPSDDFEITLPPLARSRRVLVVDDNPYVAEALSMQLEMLGHEVQMVHNGQAAIKTARTFHPDIVLLDLGLPGMNGFEVAQSFRQDPEMNEVVLIAVSGYGQAEDIARSKAAGFDKHIVKPVSSEILQAAMATRPDTALASKT